ncbi:MAG: diaminopimelate decarboxylase, partial [Firmicutes bacterium]|nr:diaminopimelate decarboxylase [Bacillota bacterium]
EHGPEKQDILLRLTPGIDPHTFVFVDTGRIDTKFGFGISTGQAEEALNLALSLPHVNLKGFHCHVGSQVFDSDVYMKSADKMLEFVKLAKERYGYTCGTLNLGGGYGVRYTKDDPEIDIDENIRLLAEHVKAKAAELGIDVPAIALEPGRSIVADAGLTLYKVGFVKKIPEMTTYVGVDGGMTDNVRYAMYQAKYTVVAPEKMEDEDLMLCTLAGRSCDGGDIIQPDVYLPADIKRGDLVAVLTTGAYNYSMSSNYNRLPKPAVVMIGGGESYVAVKRQTVVDLFEDDI